MNSQSRCGKPSSLLAVLSIVALSSFILPSRKVQAATRFILARTITSLTPTGGGFFGEARAAVGDKFLVRARDDCTTICDGAVHQFDGATGAFIRSFFNPGPKAFKLFENWVAASGKNVLNGALREEKGRRSGAAYLFDGTTGELTTTLLNPACDVSDSFAWDVTVIGNGLLAGSPFQTSDPKNPLQEGVACLFQPG